ncbi:unnamed protein product [Penicillium pancosmium]
MLSTSKMRDCLVVLAGHPMPKVMEGLTVGMRLPVFLQRINTTQSVRAQVEYYEHFSSIYAHNFSATPCYEFGCIILPLLARLNQDQNLHDSVKNLCTTGTIHGLIRDADILEPIEFFVQACEGSTSQMTADLILSFAFLKTKVLLDLTRLDAATTTIGSKFPQEIMDLILLGVPLSNTVTDNRAIMESNDLSAIITNLSSQVDIMYTMAHKQNKYFWRKLALHDPNDPLVGIPTAEEMANRGHEFARGLFLRHAHHWFQTPGAIAPIKQKIESRA